MIKRQALNYKIQREKFILCRKTSSLEVESWLSSILGPESSILQAIECLEASSSKIILVAGEEMKLMGTITDGDIRRALLANFTLESKICQIMTTAPLVVSSSMSDSEILEIMETKKIDQIPVINKNQRLVGLRSRKLIHDKIRLPNTFLIMAGGEGKRLYPYTNNCPKPMLSVGGKPIIEHIIERAKRHGFVNFIISVHYLGNIIEDYLGDGKSLGVKISYLRETMALGTAGCLSLIEEIPRHPILITNGDVLTNLNYKNILNYHEEKKADATMVVRGHVIKNDFGVVQISGENIIGFEEKPEYKSYINAGIYVLSPSSLTLMDADQRCDMPDLFEKLASLSKKTIVYLMHEQWTDVGRIDDYISLKNSKF